MATTLYLRSADASTHRGTNTSNLAGSAVGWNPFALSTTRGGGVIASDATATVTGATNGIEVTKGARMEWLSEPIDADTTISGTITANIWTAESSMNANVAINVKIDKVAATDGTITQIVKSTRTTEEAVTTRAAANFTTGMTSGYTPVALNKGDRIRLTVFGDDAGTMATGFTFNIGYNGASAAADGDTYITFNETFGFQTSVAQETGATGIPLGSNSLNQKWGQSFQVASSLALDGLQILASTNSGGTPTDDVTFEIQADTAGSPSGTALASATVTSADWIESTWLMVGLTGITLTAATTYWLVAYRTGSIGTPVRTWQGSNSDLYAGGQLKGFNGSVWSTGSILDSCFRLVPGGSTLYLTDTASGIEGIVTSSETVNSSYQEIGFVASAFKRAQSFQVSATADLSAVGFLTGSNGGTPTDGVVVEIQSNSGGVPSNTVLSTATVASASWVASGWNTVDLPTVTLSASTTYWLVLYRTGSADVSNYRRWNGDGTSPYASGQRATHNGTSWSAEVGDNAFRIYAPLSTNREAWTSRGGGVQNDVTNTTAGWTAPVQVTDTAGGTVVDWFSKQLTAFTLSGLVKVNRRVLESNAAANASVGCEIARVDSDGSNATVWGYANRDAATTSGGAGEIATTETAYTIYVSGDDLAFTDGQRIRIRLFHDDCADVPLVTGHSLTSYYGGTSAGASGDTYAIFPQTLTEFTQGKAFAPPRRYPQRAMLDFDPWSVTGWQ